MRIIFFPVHDVKNLRTKPISSFVFFFFPVRSQLVSFHPGSTWGPWFQMTELVAYHQLEKNIVKGWRVHVRKVVQQILCHGIVLPLGGNVSNDSEVTMAMYPYFLTMLRKEGAFYRRKVRPTLTFKMF